MKKAASIFLALCLGAALFAGCAQQGGLADADGLSDAQVAAEAAAGAEGNLPADGEDVPEGAYVIVVQDADDGTPIKDVMVQFCSDAECRMEKSDGDGRVAFEADPGKYTVKLLKVPSGYAGSEEEIAMTASSRKTVITLKKTKKKKKIGEETNAAAEEEAQQAPSYRKTDASWDCPKTGFVLELPANIKDFEGQVFGRDCGEVKAGSGVVYGYMGYAGRTDADRSTANELIAGLDFVSDPEGAEQKAREIVDEYNSVGEIPVLVIVGIRDGVNYDEAMKLIFDEGEMGKTGDLGKVGDYRYYYVATNPDVLLAPYKDKNSDEMLSEVRSLMDQAEEIGKSVKVKGPAESACHREVNK
ncbi:MAG: hypothetical protein Q4A32_00755 [Lachnospiraceae bacterium]|nr:hypothetical protein [Lachnospiraceae bacterium]